jgi:serine/threonine protein kinase
MANLRKGTIIQKKWKLGDIVGEGACGKVYEVFPMIGSPNCNFSLVAKVIPLPSGKGKAAKEQKRLCDTLYYEYTLMHSQLSSFPYRPNIPDVKTFHGTDDDINIRYMVMERLDRDLVGFSCRKPSPTTSEIADIGLQLLDGLEWLHNKGLLFVDVKPENFMLKGNQLFFVDYGLVKSWRNASGAKAMEVVAAMDGTPTFASLNVHNNCSPMRRDDIEAMVRVLKSRLLETVTNNLYDSFFR